VFSKKEELMEPDLCSTQEPGSQPPAEYTNLMEAFQKWNRYIERMYNNHQRTPTLPKPFQNDEDKGCVLCKKNGKPRAFYSTHVLKDNKGVVICPVLRDFTCPRCGATGDHAHTLRHCPIARMQNHI
jgi:hypothetical protein